MEDKYQIILDEENDFLVVDDDEIVYGIILRSDFENYSEEEIKENLYYQGIFPKYCSDIYEQIEKLYEKED